MSRPLLLGSFAASLALALTGTRLDADGPAKNIADFRLKDATGKTVALGDFKDKKALVVIFIGTQCPINNTYMPRLAELHKTFQPQGVGFLAINANDHDTVETIAAHAKKHSIPFSVLRDGK